MADKYDKTVIIMRAVSGSGKTTISRCIIKAVEYEGLKIAIHSTDNFFMVGSKYVFEIDKLADYHNNNLENFTADLKKDVDVVICDNMNLLPWQSEHYTNMARKYGYKIIILNFLPRSLDKHLAAQKITPEKPDAHNLSEELLTRLIDDFNIYNDILDKDHPIIAEKHFTYIWDNINCERKRTNMQARRFDSDLVIIIKPDEYQQVQHTIGQTMLKFIQKDN